MQKLKKNAKTCKKHNKNIKIKKKKSQKRRNSEVREILKRHTKKFTFSVLALYKHFRINDALTTQRWNMRRKLKQKRCNFEITEIWKRRNFEADAERGDANRGISVLVNRGNNLPIYRYNWPLQLLSRNYDIDSYTI